MNKLTFLIFVGLLVAATALRGKKLTKAKASAKKKLIDYTTGVWASDAKGGQSYYTVPFSHYTEFVKNYMEQGYTPRITKIEIWSGGFGPFVHGFATTYKFTKGTEVIEKVVENIGSGASTDGQVKTIVLDSDEYLIAAAVSAGLVIDRMCLATNKQRSWCIGGTGGNFYEFTQEINEIIAFGGGLQTYLENLKIYTKLSQAPGLTSVEPVKQVEIRTYNGLALHHNAMTFIDTYEYFYNVISVWLIFKLENGKSCIMSEPLNKYLYFDMGPGLIPTCDQEYVMWDVIPMAKKGCYQFKDFQGKYLTYHNQRMTLTDRPYAYESEWCTYEIPI